MNGMDCGASRNDGILQGGGTERNMLRPYGLTCTYPDEPWPPATQGDGGVASAVDSRYAGGRCVGVAGRRAACRCV